MFRVLTSTLVPKTLNFGFTRAKSTSLRVFVYGTLKRDQPNHHYLSNKENGACKFYADGTTVKKYPLILATEYKVPFLLKYPGKGHHVKGEVYDIDDKMLSQLDTLENHPYTYERALVDISIRKDKNSKEEQVKCWVYFLQKFDPDLLNSPTLESYTFKHP